jgi:hypothetical protein
VIWALLKVDMNATEADFVLRLVYLTDADAVAILEDVKMKAACISETSSESPTIQTRHQFPIYLPLPMVGFQILYMHRNSPNYVFQP